MLTQQEINIVNFLKDKEEAYWEELAQFSKDPTRVKLKSIKRTVSEIKKKFKDNNFECPIKTKLSLLSGKQMQKSEDTADKITVNNQQLVRVPRPTPAVIETKQCHKDFVINKFNRQIRSKDGIRTLNDDDFIVFEYIYSKPEKVITLEELRDEVVYPKFGSKTPARWFSAIQRRVNNIRRLVPELRNRLLTVKVGVNGSGYLLQ
jgi:hypothetical protein